jgi:hypothetical protein
VKRLFTTQISDILAAFAYRLDMNAIAGEQPYQSFKGCGSSRPGCQILLL